MSSRLSKHKVPKYWKFVTHFPQTRAFELGWLARPGRCARLHGVRTGRDRMSQVRAGTGLCPSRPACMHCSVVSVCCLPSSLPQAPYYCEPLILTQ